MRKQVLVAIAVIGALGAATAAWAATFTVAMKNGQFSNKSIKIKVGDSVGFKNMDSYLHNPYSLSNIQSFNLGAYPQGQTKIEVFSRPGTVSVGCAIHPNEKMTIQIIS